MKTLLNKEEICELDKINMDEKNIRNRERTAYDVNIIMYFISLITMLILAVIGADKIAIITISILMVIKIIISIIVSEYHLRHTIDN